MQIFVKTTAWILRILTHLQRLFFNTKPLMDEKSLLDYKIQKENNLYLKFQKLHRSADPENVPGPSVDWSKVANIAKSKVDQEIEEKKRKYEALLKKKSKVAAKTDDVKAEIKHSLAVTEEAVRKVLTTENKIKADEQFIEKLNDELKKANEAIQDRKRVKWNITRQIDEETRKRMVKREELCGLRVKKEKLEEEMEETSLVASDRLQKGNDELVKVNTENTEKDQAMREFLNETIVEKESWLECPVCFYIAFPPIYKCTKEHLICSKCFPRVNSKCPTCRTGFAKNDSIFRLAEENWRELQKMKDKMKEF